MEKVLIVIGFHIILRYNDGVTFGCRVQDMRDPWGEHTVYYANYLEAAHDVQLRQAVEGSIVRLSPPPTRPAVAMRCAA